MARERRGSADARDEGRGRIRSHLLPRSGPGRFALALFLLLMALAQPPVVHGLVNRIDPWILGMPFLFAWLLGVYAALIGLLVWVMRRGL